MEKELFGRWPEIAIVLFISFNIVTFILTKVKENSPKENEADKKRPCGDLEKFKSEARNKMSSNEKAGIELNLKIAAIEGKLDLANNELNHLKSEQVEMKDDIKEIRKDLNFVVSELRNGTGFAKR